MMTAPEPDRTVWHTSSYSTDNGDCVQVGSLKSLWVPGKDAYQDLDPSDGGFPLDEYGASFAASQGNSAVEKGACDFHPGR
jgi:hypothetical protein